MSGSETDIQWFIARDGKQHGPVSDLELKKIVELTHLKPTDLVWRQGFTDWRAASSVFPELATPAAPAASPAPAPAITSSPSPAAATASAPEAAKPTSTASSPVAQSPAPASSASQSYAGFSARPSQESWRAQNEPPTRSEPTTAARTLGGPAQRTAGPFPTRSTPAGPSPGPGPGPAPVARQTTDSRKPSELAAQPRPQAEPASRGRRLALVAAGLIAMTGAGAWISSQYTDEMFTYLQSDDNAPLETGAAALPAGKPDAASKGTATAAAIPAAVTATATTTAAGPVTADDIDRDLQNRGIWVTIKQEFPDWYQARVTDLTRFSSEQKSQVEIGRYLATSLVAFRRENAKYALAAGTSRHKELAAAFLANLNMLSRESGDSCYDFISKGELSTTIIERIGDPAKSTEIDAQVSATLGAIVDGKKQPSEHSAPVKTDYDVLAGELGRLGWTQADMQLFANPKALAQAPRARVCNMLKDWFTAHLAIQDPSTQERLLFETLKPVISG